MCVALLCTARCITTKRCTIPLCKSCLVRDLACACRKWHGFSLSSFSLSLSLSSFSTGKLYVVLCMFHYNRRHSCTYVCVLGDARLFVCLLCRWQEEEEDQLATESGAETTIEARRASIVLLLQRRVDSSGEPPFRLPDSQTPTTTH